MIKNAQILKNFERQTCRIVVGEDWYKKADALYETAMCLNPEVVKDGGPDHIEMLIRVRKKLKAAKTQMNSAK